MDADPRRASTDGSSRAASTAFLTTTWRSGWRSLLVLALIIGLTGGTSSAAMAGARRSASALDRFHDAGQTLDVFLSADITTPEPPAMRALLESPLVESHNDLVFLFVNVEEVGFFFAPTSRDGVEIERGVLLEGRRADPDNPDEVALSEGSARALGLGVGDTLVGGSITQDTADRYLETGFEEPTELDGPEMRLKVVGLVRNGFDLAALGDGSSLTIPTPAFLDKYGEIGRGSVSHMVRLADVPGAVDAFTDGVAEAYGDERLPSINVGQGEDTVADSMSVITAALVALGAVLFVAGAAWIATTAGRQQRLAAGDVEVLRALGSTPTDRRLLLMGTVAPGIVGGFLLAFPLAVALSPLFPVGASRRVDPDPGLHLDLSALLLAALALATVVVVATAASATRLVDRPGNQRDLRVPIVDRVARSLRPAPGTGVRFALHAPSAVSASVRPALIGAWVGVVGLVAVAVLGASLERLVDTPARWGATWDVAVAGDDVDREAILDNVDIEAAAVLLYDEQLQIDGVEALTMTLDPVKADVSPTIVDGRAPRAADEIALARDTFDAVDVPLGEAVEVESREQISEAFTVVGVIAFPTIGEPISVARGAALTGAGGDRLRLGDSTTSDDVGVRYLVIRWVAGVDEPRALAALGERGSMALAPDAPPEIKGLDDVRGFPLLAAVALAVLGVIATSHALFATVRRRRLELGVLSAFGFAPSQRRSVIAAQATAIALVALVVGLPLGAVVGRLTWSVIARSMGVAGDALVPLPLLAAAAIGLVALLNLLAVLPARTAGRLDVADALRSE